MLIDELDATLFPAAQKKLVEVLFKFAAEYSIQIIATSHSRAVIETVLLSKYKYSGKLLYLRNKGESIVIENNVTLDQIQADLTIKPIKADSLPKIRVYTEDTEALEFVKCLLGTKYTKLLRFVDVKIGCKELITLSTKRKIPEFTENLIILDGDSKNPAKNIIPAMMPQTVMAVDKFGCLMINPPKTPMRRSSGRTPLEKERIILGSLAK